MKKILLLILASFLFLNAANKVEKTTEKNVEQTTKEDTSLAESDIEIENMVEANILNEKISKIELSLKDNILLKRYSNYLSYGKISAELDNLKDSLKRKNNLSEEESFQLSNKIRVK